MNDVAFEWFIPYVPDMKKRLMKAVMISAALVLFFDAVFFAAALLWPALILAIVDFFLFRSWKFEYEFEYVNGDLDVAKVIRKIKRKEIYHTSRVEFEEFSMGRREAGGRQTRDFTSGRPNAPVCSVLVRGQIVYIEPSDEFLEEMRKYYRF